MTRLPRREIASGYSVARITTGLWQVADQERDGRPFELDAAAEALAAYIGDGFDTIDMADHYGSAEIIAGKAVGLAAHRPVLMTKWVPEPGPMTPDVVRAAVEHSLERLGVDRIDLLQLHWWTYGHSGYLDAMAELTKLREEGLIGHIGLTNFDTAHLRLLLKQGFEIATNQVCFSLLDRRAAGAMSELCARHGVHILAFGTLAGGFLSERWLGAEDPERIGDWSKAKYRRYIDAAGGWQRFQALLRVLDWIAKRHEVSIANVACRWVLDHPAVASIIIGARLGEREHRQDNARTLSFELDEEDRRTLDAVLEDMTPIPGDCGDEYRKPPFLTASGDLRHHLDSLPKAYPTSPVEGRPGRIRVETGSEWEAACGYARAVRVRDRILVSGTTATHGADQVICPGDVEGQTVHILDRIGAAIEALGGSIEDVVRTRIYMKDSSRWEEAARVHGRVFGETRPANTLVEIRDLVGDYDIEIEAEAIIGE